MSLECAFHVVSYAYDPDKVFLIPEDLCNDSFPAFTRIEVGKDMLSCYMMVYDMSVPLSVFARKDMLDQIEIPEAAKRKAVNTMVNRDPKTDFLKIDEPLKKEPEKETGPVKMSEDGYYYCPCCGAKYKELIRFCSECGSRLKD